MVLPLRISSVSPRSEIRTSRTNLGVSPALVEVQAFLQSLKDQGKITGFKGPDIEDGIVYAFTAYVPNAESFDRSPCEHVISIGRKNGVTIFLDVEQDAQSR